MTGERNPGALPGGRDRWWYLSAQLFGTLLGFLAFRYVRPLAGTGWAVACLVVGVVAGTAAVALLVRLRARRGQ